MGCQGARGSRWHTRSRATTARREGKRLNDPVPFDNPAGTRSALIGLGIDRVEDARLLRGEGAFVDDLRRPGMLHAVVLRSPVAHARVLRVDVTAARTMPGVHDAFAAAEVTEYCNGTMPHIPMLLDPLPEATTFLQPVIAHLKVRYVGEPLAVVVAQTQALAEDALEAIVVEIESLPAVVDGGLDAGDEVPLFEPAATNRVVRLDALRGDADAAFATAPFVRRERFEVHRHFAAPIEPRGLLAHREPDSGRLVVSGAAKMPFANRRILAGLLGLREDVIDLLEADTGGAFGQRGEFYPEDFLVPFAALRCGYPVKWIEDRRENLIAANHAREAACELEIACTLDGTVLALRGRVATDIGAYLRTTGLAQSRNIAQVSTGPYRIPSVAVSVDVRVTNKTPSGPYRGPGRFETDFFRERLFDIVAGELGIDRVAFRRRNLLCSDEMPWALPTLMPFHADTSTDSGNYGETLERCLQVFDWQGKVALDGRQVDGRWHGLGIGCYIEGGGAGPREGARLVLEADGRVSVYTGASLVGQGLETVFTQIAADALGLPISAIRGVFHGSTTGVHEGFGSYSSRSTAMGGSAIVIAARTLREMIMSAATTMLVCNRVDLALVGGDRIIARGGRSLSLADIGLQHAATGGVCAHGSFASTNRTYSYGAHAAHVAVDPRTGAIEVIDYVAVEDVGRIINPRTLEGQALGAIVQGLGGVFLERLAYDSQGQLQTGSLADYLLPTATCFPRIRIVALENYPTPHNPLGAKGAGEGGIIPVGGVIANAVSAALARLGVSVTDLPLSPSRVWTLIGRRS
ncbi:MAG: xanthine dehydrogenase family protein molybdopterin-binding subunit [Proteobacteria bacterium]|nr:xanthine dehydrogenase family protein molybdopterin-binding subunit [Burkholderiales bacterium]